MRKGEWVLTADFRYVAADGTILHRAEVLHHRPGLNALAGKACPNGYRGSGVRGYSRLALLSEQADPREM